MSEVDNNPEPRPGWCHCMFNTYGTWLPGDPRGFRTRKHRDHVEGDYKSPPPDGMYEVHSIELIAIAACAMHVHLLGRFPAAQTPTDSIRGLRATDPVRHFVGIAKKESAKRLAGAGLAGRGGVWAKRGKIVRVRDRSHQVNVYRYILRHRGEGAAVWSVLDETKKPTD